jgi:hypothetical protein
MSPQLFIDNETYYDGRRVGKAVRFVFRELGLTGDRVVVRVKHHRGTHAYAGRIYYNAPRSTGWIEDGFDAKVIQPRVPAGYRTLIVCRVGLPDIYPCETHVYKRRDAPEPWTVNDWQEALVAVAAHEAMHLRQHVLGKPARESETEWAAFRLWRRWVRA